MYTGSMNGQKICNLVKGFFTFNTRNMDQFIRAKYERKQYAMRGPMPDPGSLGSGVCFY